MHRYRITYACDTVTRGLAVITQFSYCWRYGYKPVDFVPKHMPLHLVVAELRYYDTAARALWTAP